MTSLSISRTAPTDRVCRLSVYLTLACALVTLAYAQAELFSLNIIFATVAGAVLALAYVKHGTWVLSERASNAWAMAVALGTVLWIGLSFALGYPEWVTTTPAPGVLLPFTGQFLTCMLLLMLFRPRGPHEVYWLHVFAAVLVALACVLAVQPLFVIFLVSYLVAAVWSLMLLSEHRDAWVAPDRAPEGTRAPAEFGAAARRSAWVAALACLLFFVTPRMTDTEWNFTLMLKGTQSVRTGFSPQIDLHHTGQRQVSGKIAFEAFVQDSDGNPKLNLGEDRRWRGVTLDHYEDGRWMTWRRVRPPDARRPSPWSSWVRRGRIENLPRLGSGELVFTVSLKPAETGGGLFLSDPVVLPASGSPPLVGLSEDWQPFFNLRDSVLVGAGAEAPPEYRYAQATRSLSPSEYVPAIAADEDFDTFKEYFVQLIKLPRAPIVTWTRRLLRQLVSEGVLTPDDLREEVDHTWCETPLPLPQHREKIARALESYLTRGSDFAYTLDLRRQDPKLDPAEDFLFNVRQGHCEHFATALVLMLRSARIPARMVNGFRGAHTRRAERGDGWYAVQESDAHAWVEALVPAPGATNRKTVCWITLDPSPGEAEAAQQAASNWDQWWEYQKSLARAYWRGVFVEGSTEPVYDGALPLLQSWLVQTPAQGQSGNVESGSSAAVGVVVGVALTSVSFIAGWVWALRRRRRTRARRISKRPAPVLAFFARLEAVAQQRSGIRRAASETPQEFARAVAGAWRTAGLDVELAGVPALVANAFDEIRYGGRQAAASMPHDIERQIDRADAALLDRDGRGADS